ncbi:MAG: sigma 54-interacting transcriptional regulator [Deltaproteobacteria bacterium]|nr:sigma 54-interacting transcriptional regulator [Deltaproteobacteria bacterium]MBN2671758.1 sigma 54-interacting transcriptional regulator [Deltaproteobacteria bacterium]
MPESNFTQEQYHALHVIAADLAKPGPFDPALQTTLNQMHDFLGVERGMVTIFRRDIDQIHTIAGNQMTEEATEKARYRPGEGIVGRVFRSGQPIVVPRMDQEPLFLNRSGTRDDIDLSNLSFICVPISFGQEIVGTLSADFHDRNADMLQSDLRLLESIANLIASRVERRRIMEENKRLKDPEALDSHHSIIGSSDAIKYVRQLIAQVADSRTSVLLTGETGTGKGLVARAIHRMSPRKDQPFVHLNCGAIPEHLIESELFGHEKGAFTGAVATREGRFEAAKNGTIFLDEINSLPAQAQVKLLKVIQDREFERVGSSKTTHTNARIITATNKDLESEVESGAFRADLFYRLNVFPILIPPLRNRGADIVLLTDHFINRYAEEMGKTVERIDTPAIDLFMSYHWPGNVRELENAVERAVLLSEAGVITSRCLPPSLQMKSMEDRSEKRGRLEQLVAVYEMGLIKDALKDAEGNQTKAAEFLETTKRIIQYKIKKYKINYRQYRKSATFE